MTRHLRSLSLILRRLRFTRRGGTPVESRRIFLSSMILCVAGLMASGATRMQDEGTTRHLWDTAYINEGSSRVSSRKTSKKLSYRVATPKVPAKGVTADTVIGVTIWRLRPARSAETGERIVVHEEAGATEWVPQRVSADTTLAEGDRLRISIEAARTGYLYVIDREQYADGSVGEPFLIFPTTRTRGGDNQVKIARVIEIPAQDDSPPYFTLKRSRSNHVGENLIVLVSPNPIEGLQVSSKAQRLSDEQIVLWEKSWGGQTGRLEMEKGEGKPWTEAERNAGADGTRGLTVDEPAPQTIYYRPGASSTVPVLVTLQLKYAAPLRRSKRR